MNQIRLATKDDTERLKQIWKLSFGDEDSFINFFYTKRYKADDTMVLAADGQIAAMLTIIPVDVTGEDARKCQAAMLYAIATHPAYRNKGLARQLIEFANQKLAAEKVQMSLLVPADQQLFQFYQKLGYQEGFLLREVNLSKKRLHELPVSQAGRISAVSPAEYNRRRNKQLQGRTYIEYREQDIAYQKELSCLSGADIYALDLVEGEGCMAVERISPDKVLIKEILIAEELLYLALNQVAQVIAADEYMIRTPVFLGEKLGGSCRPFGMFRATRDINGQRGLKPSGYLGLAFD